MNPFLLAAVVCVGIGVFADWCVALLCYLLTLLLLNVFS